MNPYEFDRWGPTPTANHFQGHKGLQFGSVAGGTPQKKCRDGAHQRPKLRNAKRTRYYNG